MKAAAFALASLAFALGLASTLGGGYGYDNYGSGYGNGYGYGGHSGGYGYSGHSGYTGYGSKGGAVETTVQMPYYVPQPVVLPNYGAVGAGQDSGLFGLDEGTLLILFPLLFLLLNQSTTSG